MNIIQIPTDRWQEYRNIRLKSLQDYPIAFDSSIEEEENLSEDEWKDKLKHGYHVFAEDNGKLIGKMEVEWRTEKKIRHIGELFGVYIDPEYRGKGVGELLWKDVERLAREHGLEKFWLDVVETQKAAYGLYKKLGFIEVGKYTKAAKVNGIYYDKILMEKFI